MALDRQQLVDLLRHLGYEEAAEEAARVLPDPVTLEQVQAFGDRYHINHDELVNRMGGSP